MRTDPRLCVDAVVCVLTADHDETAVDPEDLDVAAIQLAERLGGHHLVGCADAESPADQIEHAVDVGEDRVDLVGDEHDRGPGASPALVDESTTTC